MNASTLRLWVDNCVYTEHKRVCEAAVPPLNPREPTGIIHVDAYPVHLAQEFRDWLKEKHPQFRLIYVSANGTSEIQFADLVLNKPFKNYMSRHYTAWMIETVQKELDEGTPLKEIKFDQVVTKAAGPSLSWMLKAYDQLGELDHVPGLTSIGHHCFEDKQFIITALTRSSDLLQETLTNAHQDRVEPAFNDDDLALMGDYLDLE